MTNILKQKEYIFVKKYLISYHYYTFINRFNIYIVYAGFSSQDLIIIYYNIYFHILEGDRKRSFGWNSSQIFFFFSLLLIRKFTIFIFQIVNFASTLITHNRIEGIKCTWDKLDRKTCRIFDWWIPFDRSHAQSI